MENQRTRKEKALRIPGPREFERGEAAVEVDDDNDGQTLGIVRTRDDKSTADGYGNATSRSFSFAHTRTNASSHMRMRRIPTMDRIVPHAASAIANVFTMGGAKPNNLFKSPSTPKEQPPMPYLSYTPTIGRNSQFVDLDEEQREELGGIEYRSLKLLLKILIGKQLCASAGLCHC